jgi:hypothetical protein
MDGPAEKPSRQALSFFPLLARTKARPARLSRLPSTVVRRLDYLPERQELIVELTTGRRYLYSDVPEQEADGMRSAFAKGV